MRKRVASVAVLAALVGGGVVQSSWARPDSRDAVRRAANCLPYIVLDSRGSGEPYGTSPPGAAFLKEFRRLKGEANVGVIGNPYPARGNFALVGAFFSVPGAYHQSVVEGKNWLRSELDKETKTCASSGTQFLLTGYSQGAQVTADVYQEKLYADVLGVALFGDPYFNGLDGFVDRGTYRSDLYGALGRRPRFIEAQKRHVMSFCHLHDPVCQASNSSPLALRDFRSYGTSQHKNYHSLGDPERAARYFASIASSAPAPAPGSSPTVLSVANTAYSVGGAGAATLYFADADCDVVGGTWYGNGSSHDFGNGKVQPVPGGTPYSCAGGRGSFSPFTVNCGGPGEWTEAVVIRDAQGHESPRFTFAHRCG